MNKKTEKKELSLNKIKVSKITNLQTVKGGDDLQAKKTCAFPENASKKSDNTIHI